MEEKGGRKVEVWGGLLPIYRTSAPLGTGTVMTLALLRTRLVVLRPSRCFCSVLPVALFLFSVPSPPLPLRIERDHSSVLFFRRFFHVFPAVSSFFLLGHRYLGGLDISSALISCPCFHRVLLFSSRSSSPFPSSVSFHSLSIFSLSSPSPPSCPRPHALRPVVAFFCSLFPHAELVFLSARWRVRGCSRMEGRGTRMRMRG